MSTKNTKFPKNSNRSIHQGTTIVGKNGLAIDALATLEPAVSLIRGAQTLSYSAPTVTLHNSVDLTSIINYDAMSYAFTGVLLFTDSSGASYLIDKESLNNTTKTFNIYIDEGYTNYPNSITTASEWLISEADLVNRLQTTSSAVIDRVEFRDVDVKFSLDGDPVRIIDSEGHELDINPDGSINITLGNLTTPVIANINLPIANTEYSYNFPINTKKFKINARGNSKLQLAYISGNTNTQFITIFPGNCYEESNLNLSSTIYFRATKSLEVIEILSWS